MAGCMEQSTRSAAESRNFKEIETDSPWHGACKEENARSDGIPALNTMVMNKIPLSRAMETFFMLQSLPCSQSGVMRVERGAATSDSPECNPDCAQTVLLIEGELIVEVGEAGETIRTGASLTVPAGVKHRFINRSNSPAVAFTVLA